MDGQSRRKRLRKVFRKADPTLLEWCFAVLKIGLGLWYLFPTAVFHTSAHLYRYMAVVPQGYWGAFMFILGVAQLAVWYVNSRLWRFRLGALGALYWGVYGSLLWSGDHRSPALVFMFTLAAFKEISYYFLKNN